ncbi:MAG: choice-of-anchor D domain-containing protein [Terracidiphilus sp.]
MRTPSYRKWHGSAPARGTVSVARNAMLFLFFCGALSLSGCIGLTSANPTASSQKTPAAGSLDVTPGSINFGSVAIGAVVSQSVTVSNKGGTPVSVTQASTAASGFTISSANLPLSVGAGQQATLNVSFSPKSTGAVGGTLSLVSNASSSPSAVSLSGTGVTPSALLNASASSLSFGSVSTGAAKTLGVTLTNAGNSKVTISSVKLTGAQFAASGVSGGVILSPGQNVTLDVTFSPAAAGTLTGSVTVASNATNSPAVISFSGTASAAQVSHSVTLGWNADASAAAYNVYRSSASGGPFTNLTPARVAATQYADSAVQAGQTYYYKVTAVTSAGVESAPSSPVSAAVP